ncbi:transglycosylase SLT domain-containing protein [candidate division WOR-3 bacterium]|nr:transglycosylase SLT domain-containing protein [candidate division WOR-3 bacterium]
MNLKIVLQFAFALISVAAIFFQTWTVFPKSQDRNVIQVPQENCSRGDYWEIAEEEVYSFVLNCGSGIVEDTVELIVEAIVEYSMKYNINPYVVAAVIYSESRFQYDAVGLSGDAGLMQIIPSTAKLIAGAVSQESFDLKEIRTNVKFGCWYLSALKRGYGGNWIKTLGLYNQGGNWEGAGERYAFRVIEKAEEAGMPLRNIILFDEMNYRKNGCMID